VVSNGLNLYGLSRNQYAHGLFQLRTDKDGSGAENSDPDGPFYKILEVNRAGFPQQGAGRAPGGRKGKAPEDKESKRKARQRVHRARIRELLLRVKKTRNDVIDETAGVIRDGAEVSGRFRIS
jgi:hypothetical protein